MQPQLARTTRTCSYDRAGLGGSPAIPGSLRDASDELADLERLLTHADLEPPYVLVGHSYGGLLAQLYAHRHTPEVAGVVLVDAVHPDWRDRAWASIPSTAELDGLRPTYSPLVRDVDLSAGEALARRVRSLGAMRLAVVTAGHPGSPLVPPSFERSLGTLWDSMQRKLAKLSSDSMHVVAVNSDHVVQSPLTGQPAVVLRAVRAIVDAYRGDVGLGPCESVFRGLAVECRG